MVDADALRELRERLAALRDEIPGGTQALHSAGHPSAMLKSFLVEAVAVVDRCVTEAELAATATEDAAATS